MKKISYKNILIIILSIIIIFGLLYVLIAKNMNISDVKIIRNTTESLVKYDNKKLIDSSNIIIQGKVIEKSEPFMIVPIQSENREPKFFTDVFIEVSKIYKGTPLYSENKLLTIRIPGGEGEYLIDYVEDNPTLDIDSEYVFFLYKIENGSDYNIEGNHYYIVGMNQGVWRVEPVINYGMKTGDISIMESEDSAFNQESFSSFVRGFQSDVETGIKDGSERKEDIENLYKNNQITQEEYKEKMRLLEEANQHYAHIMSEEEQHEYEYNFYNNFERK